MSDTEDKRKRRGAMITAAIMFVVVVAIFSMTLVLNSK